MVIFGGLGYLMKKFKYEGAPLVLALVLGPLLENSLRQTLLISNGSFMIFLTRPISAILVVVMFALLVLSFASKLRPGRRLAAED